MRAIYSSILCFILLAIFCEAYPAISDSSSLSFSAGDLKEMDAERSAQIFNRYDKMTLDHMDDTEQDNEYQDTTKKLWRSGVTGSNVNEIYFRDNEFQDRTNTEETEDSIYYNMLEKRASSKGKYNYYRCYFNPVTCYRK